MTFHKLIVLVSTLMLFPPAAHAWWDDQWHFRKQITVDTSAQGGAITEAQKDFPVLLRLDSSNLTFDDIKTGGADLRFVAQDDKTPLAYQIESFDARLGLAMIWIKLPELPASGQQKIFLYYGNKKAELASAPAQSFGPAYRAVYHFLAAEPARDATSNRSDLTAAPVSASASWIAGGAHFDGSRALPLPASPALAVQPTDGFTFEAWIHPQAPTASAGTTAAPLSGQTAILFSRRAGANALLIGLAGGTPYVEVTNNGRTQRATAGSAAAGDWSHIAVTATAGSTNLYIDGQQAGAITLGVPALGGGALLGGDASGNGFIGDMDEVRLSGTARSAEWIKATYVTQGRGGRLLAYGKDEEPGGNGGAFGTIIKNTPFDAWVVIGILGVMFVIAVWVMYTKAVSTSRLQRANAVFLKRWSRMTGDLTQLEQAGEVGAGERRALAASPLYHLYQRGIAELDRRRAEGMGGALSAETIAAMRAALDAQLVRETRRIKSNMVLLTIAIAGGPFIGLLGTVLGVMITFGAIAAAGDVNVNAIAPGIAAALLATVAGLAVAIPSLFGYNYLNTRIGTEIDEMRVFIDELITRMAETFRHRAAPTPARQAA